MTRKISFYILLFFSLAGFGVWFQQNYMEIYSQEFELELKADRTKAEFVNAKEFEVDEYKSGLRASRFQGKEARLLNNGALSATGNLVYTIFSKDDSARSRLHAAKVLAQVHLATDTPNLADPGNRLEWVFVPGDVKATTDTDTIRGKAVHYDPDKRLFDSKDAVLWTAKGRNFSGMGFKYVMGSDDIIVGGPIKGNFIPTKNDVSGFGKAEVKQK